MFWWDFLVEQNTFLLVHVPLTLCLICPCYNIWILYFKPLKDLHVKTIKIAKNWPSSISSLKILNLSTFGRSNYRTLKLAWNNTYIPNLNHWFFVIYEIMMIKVDWIYLQPLWNFSLSYFGAFHLSKIYILLSNIWFFSSRKNLQMFINLCFFLWTQEMESLLLQERIWIQNHPARKMFLREKIEFGKW